MKTIGEKLREARTANGLKQSDVAAKIGCAPTSLTNWENGKVNPSLEILSKLCCVYGIEPLSLLDRLYSFDDLVEISRKQVSERAYEETIALNFSEPVLARLQTADTHRAAIEKVEQMNAFLRATSLLDRFGGSAVQKEIEAVESEYSINGRADSDILFAFHTLNPHNKAAFLSMLSGLLYSDDGLQPFADKVGILYDSGDVSGSFEKKMERAKAFTLQKLDDERERIIDSLSGSIGTEE